MISLPNYRTVWRWHFYAGLFCIPFVIILSLSGGIYLFKTEFEDWTEQPFDQLDLNGEPVKPADHVQAALERFPNSHFVNYELPKSIHSAVRVSIRQENRPIQVYVHPETHKVIHQQSENDRFMRWIREIHGELLIGENGSLLVELAASWTIVLIVTGFFLWWPRQTRGFGGVFYPRILNGSRTFWRDIHSVAGVWISLMTLFLLLSGLPWSKSWGNYLKFVRRMTGTAVARQDWSNSSERNSFGSMESGGSEHAGHRNSGQRANRPTISDYSPLNRVVSVASTLNFQHPILISPPRGKSTHWAVKSMTPNRPYRQNCVIDGTSGEVLSRDGFADRLWIDKLVAIGIAAHEGHLFGWPNQLLGVITALGLIAVCISGIVLWWRRRDRGTLGAPHSMVADRLSPAFWIIVGLMAIYLPLFGGSLLLVLLVEWGILRRIPKVRDWLGLAPSKKVTI